MTQNKETAWTLRKINWMWINLLSTDICYGTKLKIITTAVKVIEPCTDVSTESKNKYNAVCACSRLCGYILDSFIFSHFHSLLVFHFHLFHYFRISGFHLNSTDYTLFLNDHSWGLQIQKPFSWLGPLGLPYITNHIHHWGPSTCKA